MSLHQQIHSASIRRTTTTAVPSPRSSVASRARAIAERVGLALTLTFRCPFCRRDHTCTVGGSTSLTPGQFPSEPTNRWPRRIARGRGSPYMPLGY